MKTDSQENVTSEQLRKLKETDRLYYFCQDWIVTHYWEASIKGELSEAETELRDIAGVLKRFMDGEQPFSQFKNAQSGAQADIFKARVGALILTGNKKKVSEFFGLSDDGRSLNEFIASRAREFCSKESLAGLTFAQKANLVVDLVRQDSELRKEYCLIFMFCFPHFLEEKHKQDCIYENYSFRQWLKMARAKKR